MHDIPHTCILFNTYLLYQEYSNNNDVIVYREAPIIIDLGCPPHDGSKGYAHEHSREVGLHEDVQWTRTSCEVTAEVTEKLTNMKTHNL